jgi:hypothetical protein
VEVTNTLVYYNAGLIMTAKSFIIQALMKLIFFLSLFLSFFLYLPETKNDLKNCCSSIDCCPDVLAMTMDNIGVYP